MENTTTRIADLPDNHYPNKMDNTPNSFSSGGGNRSNGISSDVPTNYIPMNIHPNPTGLPAMPSLPSLAMPSLPAIGQDTQSMRQQQQPQMAQLTEEQQYQLQNRRLPSRDIPQSSIDYTQDEQIQPNYIPKSNLSSDYVRDYEATSEQKLRQYDQQKQKESRLDAIINELQMPMMIGALFFLFQLPVMNTMIFKKLSFLSIYDTDGHFNFYGLFLKSGLFGMTYYSLQMIAQFLSEI